MTMGPIGLKYSPKINMSPEMGPFQKENSSSVFHGINMSIFLEKKQHPVIVLQLLPDFRSFNT